MPTEVTPAPFRYQQQYPLALEHPRTFPSLYSSSSFPSSISPTGPVRAVDCLPGPGKVLPNGMRNPWAPYAGETYSPAHEAAAVKMGYQRRGSGSGWSALYNDGLTAVGGGGSIYGGGNGMLGPGGSHVGGGGVSVIAPRCMVSSGVGLGGYRMDDGWDGAMGRAHNGLSPDLTSTAGAIPRLASVGNWLQSPSSPLNQARMMPGVGGMYAPSSLGGGGGGGGYLQPPVAHSSNQPGRKSSIKAVPISSGCDDCYQAGVRAGSQVGSVQSASHHHRKLREGTPLAGQAGSVYNKVPASAGLRIPGDEGLVRKGSGKSKGSQRRSSVCSACG
jgi:hypothetical protein